MPEIWKKYKEKIIIWIITVVEIAASAVAAYHCNDRWLDADLASELVLAESLNQEHALLSQNWYYSTELRVINTQLVNAPLFSFFSDWTMVRAVSIFILLLILALSYAFFVKHAFGGNWKGLAVMPLLVLPFSTLYFEVVVYGSYYVPHIAISLVSMGLYFKLLHCEKRNKSFYAFAGLYLLLALAAGMGGFRQLLELYIPAFLAAFYVTLSGHLLTPSRKIIHRKTVLAALGMLASFLGLAINSMLQNVYHFADMADINTTQLSIDRVVYVFNGIINAFGYHKGNDLFSLKGILSMVAILVLILVGYLLIAAIKNEKNKEVEEYGYYVLFSAILHLVLWLFTDMVYIDRYWIPLTAMMLPLIGFGASEMVSVRYKFAKVAAWAAVICIFVNGISIFKDRTDAPNRAARNEIAAFLVNEGFSYGYADFVQANVITELTDGRIRISTVTDWNTLDSYRWLTREEDIERTVEDKIFVLLCKDEGIDESLYPYMNEDTMLFENAEYVVYSYENTQDLMQYLD